MSSDLPVTQQDRTSLFERAFREFGAELTAFVAVSVGSRETAQELVQDLFVRLWMMNDGRDAERFQRVYLYQSARNAVKQFLRHRMVESGYASSVGQTREASSPGYDTPEHDAEFSDLRHAVHRAIQALPERTRLVFMLRRHRHLSSAEVADILGITPASVDVQLWRALKHLRSALAPYLATVVASVFIGAK